MAKYLKYLRKGGSVLRHQGVLQLLIQSLQKVEKNRRANSPLAANKIKYVSLADRDEVMQADWTAITSRVAKKAATAPFTINWVMSPPSGGGGHQNIFRFIEYLDSKGHKNNVYIYSNVDDMTIAQAKDNVKAYCAAKNVSFYRYKGAMAPADAVFATGWETAYPVFNNKTDTRKLYFVQDFEPYFYPIGTDYILAENTYRFGFHGITAGGYLKHKLSQDYGMSCDSYDFGANTSLYQLLNTKKRKEVFFYARPVTERRGFDLGIMALQIFHEIMPEYTINLAGWDVSGYDIPFPYVNHKALSLGDLPQIYNQCAVALVISLTNMSLLPLELLACGTVPVVNDGPNNRLVSDNPYIAYADASPAALAKSMVDACKRQNAEEYAATAAASVPQGGWQPSLEKFEEILFRELS